MSRAPLIGVTTQTLQAIEGIPGDLPPSWVMNQGYLRSVIAAGGVPVMIPLLADESSTLHQLYRRLDGILLPGGVDVDPLCYRTARHEALGQLDPPRDTTEMLLTRWALADRKPLLGLCRGMQVLNVALGGTLWQDLVGERAGSERHDFYPSAGFTRDHLAHAVEIAAGSTLAGSLGAGTVMVNSMHHQGVRDLGPGLIATAVAADGLIEGIELADGSAVGVQWHPEVFTDHEAAVGKLFDDFVARAAGTAEAATESVRSLEAAAAT